MTMSLKKTILEDEYFGVHADFCGIEFDADLKELYLIFRCHNRSDRLREFWISDIKINGNQDVDWDTIGDLEEDSKQYYKYTLYIDEEDYFAIEKIEAEIGVDDVETGDDPLCGISVEFSVMVDTADETFEVIRR